MKTTHLDLRPILILLFLSMIWGANMAVIKIGAMEIPPLFMACIRSAVASLCLFIWIRVEKETCFPDLGTVMHGIVAGALFSGEFAFLYTGLNYTTASRGSILFYGAPFFAAIEAHFFISDDRLNVLKVIGLILAFSGIIVLFSGNGESLSFSIRPGDIAVILAGAFWGSTTVYIKKYLVGKISPRMTLFYQLLFSTPFLFVFSLLLEEMTISRMSWTGGFSIFYQCIIVAFFSYLVWFRMVVKYPVSLLHAFSFFTPVFGVFLSGVLILDEPMGVNLIISLLMVSIGMVFVNKKKQVKSGAP